MLFQVALFDSMDVGENVVFVLRRLKMYPEGDIREVVEEKLSMVGLRDIQPTDVRELRHEETRGARPAIASEPTSCCRPYEADDATGSDHGRRHQRPDHLAAGDARVTSITITACMAFVYKIADQIAMLYKGKIIEVGHRKSDRRRRTRWSRSSFRGARTVLITDESEELVAFVSDGEQSRSSGEEPLASGCKTRGIEDVQGGRRWDIGPSGADRLLSCSAFRVSKWGLIAGKGRATHGRLRHRRRGWSRSRT